MEHFVDENVVMRFYLERMNAGQIPFLRGKEQTQRQISEMIGQLLAARRMNERIVVVKKLWKVLFEAAMSSLDRDKQGYDRIFSYFDEYVEFEELIFASDSFYRDHTLHCLWVYFLGEYVAHKESFSVLFQSEKEESAFLQSMGEIMPALLGPDTESGQKMAQACAGIRGVAENAAAIRCIAALTHDLGYPLKKIEKINKSIRRILPYYSVESFGDFHFGYGNLNQPFIDTFFKILSTELNVTISVEDDRTEKVVRKLFEVKDGNLIAINAEHLDRLTEEEVQLLKKNVQLKNIWFSPVNAQIRTYNDFESYQHGIMSAFLLMKNLRAFQNLRMEIKEPTANVDTEGYVNYVSKAAILSSITLHTSDAFKIRRIDRCSFLTFIDELEEFSRISRASQSREYVEEFCTSELYMDGGWFCVDFAFHNEKLDSLDPAKAFRGRCKRFLSLFDIPKLDERLKIRLRCIGDLPWNHSVYQLEIAKNHAKILVDGIEQEIPAFLKSTQFYTSQEYAQM